MAAKRKVKEEKAIRTKLRLQKEAVRMERKRAQIWKMSKFTEIAEVLLSHTNAIPFCSRSGGQIFCAYCNAVQKNPDELREHTKRNHFSKKLSIINDISLQYDKYLKVDILDFQCSVCFIILENLEGFIKHLSNTHDQEITENIYDYIIPFKLIPGVYKCVVCDLEVDSMLNLDFHMNMHSGNFICETCGISFVTSKRMRHHMTIHQRGKFECDQCDKVFDFRRYLRKHIKQCHDRVLNEKCEMCDERFSNRYQKYLHEVKAHDRPRHQFKCPHCPKTFIWKPWLGDHVRRYHLNVKNHKCEFCGILAYSKTQLNIHRKRHTKEGMIPCTMCPKSFVTNWYLKKHIKEQHSAQKAIEAIEAMQDLEPVDCADCGRQFLSNDALMQHLTDEHQIVIAEITTEESDMI